MRSGHVLVVVLVAVCTLGTLAGHLLAESAEPTGASTVRVGLIGTLFRDIPEPLMQVVMRPFKSLLESQTGMVGEIVASGEADNLSRQLQEDQVQLGVFHGVEFAWARVKNPQLKPLVIAVNKHPYLRAALLVRSDNKATGWVDLKGRKVALPRHSKEHCRLFLERRCTPLGVALEKHYSQIPTPRDSEDALDDVVDGNVEAAVIDEVALEKYQQQKPGRARRLRTLLESEPFPCAVIAYQQGGMAESLLQRFREGMIAAHGTRQGQQLLDLCNITRFQAVPANYEQMLAEILKAYPPPQAK